MYVPLLLILPYLGVGSTHAFSLRNSLLGTTNYVAGRFAAFNRTPLRHDQQRHCTAITMSSAWGGNTAWPPTDRLSEYVTESSLVDYGKLAAEENDWLAQAISSVKKTNPETDAERHAFLINAYNLWTLHYVVRERRCSGFKGAVSTLAKARFFYWHKVSTGAGRWNLYNFENKVIRPDVNDARVHFALNCASMSCPPLRRKLFTGPGLNAELDEVTSAAINGGAMVQLREDGKTLSANPIFKWYKEDFDKEGGVLAFIQSHWTGPPLPEGAELDFFDYDWRTNIVDAAWSQRALGGAAP